MGKYHYVLASQKFLLEEEPLEEVLRERIRNYHEREKEIDFWLVKNPAFLEAPEMSDIKKKMSPTTSSYYFYRFPIYYLVKITFRTCYSGSIYHSLGNYSRPPSFFD